MILFAYNQCRKQQTLKTMESNKFFKERISEEHPKWDNCITREAGLYKKPEDIRSDFYRDYARVLHSHPYSRLKHKTQVFFATQNDHICTRMEHVHHVASVSYTIANFLGLNTELTQAIALSHDIGHAPFGHEGETRLSNISEREIGDRFWHEKNGLYVVDKIATLPDSSNSHQNFKLTYAVRDGIISHCGEIDENGVKPRNEYVDLYTISKAGDISPYTWEACVVKISDKIAYLGRDIEDAIELGLLDKKTLVELRNLIEKYSGIRTLNNTVLIHGLIIDLCKNSSIDTGLSLSEKYYKLIKDVKVFNYTHIYKHPRIESYKEYSDKVINTIYSFLASYAQYPDLLYKLTESGKQFPMLMNSFHNWLIKYSNVNEELKFSRRYENEVIYNLKNENEYKKAIVDFIAGMTDNFAIKVYHEIITF